MVRRWKSGLETEEVSFYVCEDHVKTYCSLLYEKFTEIPYTYPSLFWQYFHIPWLPTELPIILVEQGFMYEHPLTFHKQYKAKIILTKVKKIKNNTFLYHELHVSHEMKLQVIMKSTFIYKE